MSNLLVPDKAFVAFGFKTSGVAEVNFHLTIRKENSQLPAGKSSYQQLAVTSREE